MTVEIKEIRKLSKKYKKKQIESKICTECNTEKSIIIFEKLADLKNCNIKRASSRSYDFKDKISTQRKMYHEKKEKTLQQQKDKYLHFKDSLETYVEIENKVKTLEEVAVSFRATK